MVSTYLLPAGADQISEEDTVSKLLHVLESLMIRLSKKR